MLHFNKVLQRSDFIDRDLQHFILDIFPHLAATYPIQKQQMLLQAAYHRKVWEIAMSIYTLKAHGKLAGGLALGIGAAVEPTIYYLTRYMDVVATDLYNDAGVWAKEWCTPDMLANHEKYAPPDYDWNPLRLVMQHVDGRKLPYPDASFDVVFSASSIEHFGSLEDIAQAASEIGRVLKVGGMAVISTELCINPHAISSDMRLFPETKFFTRSEIIQHIVAPSGLGLVDELRTRLSEPVEVVDYSAIEGAVHTTPHLYVRHAGGCEYTSVHLAMVRPNEIKSAL